VTGPRRRRLPAVGAALALSALGFARAPAFAQPPAVAATPAVSQTPDPGAEVVNRVVLRINDRIATLHDYELRKHDLEREVLNRPDMPLEQRRELLNNLGTTVYRDLFEEVLLLSRADQLDIQATDADVEGQLTRVRAGFGLESQADFEAALAQQGMRLEEFREQIRRNLRIQAVLGREVQQAIELDEEMLRRIYRDNPQDFVTPEAIQLRELVVLEDHGGSDDERRRLASGLRSELLGGRSMAELGEEHQASGETSAAIDLGWVERGDLTPDLESAVWDLQPGEVTEPVEARGGLHLIEVVERRASEVRPFAEVADEIRANERRKRFATEYTKYVEKLEAESYVVAEPPPEAADFRRAGPGEQMPPVGLEAAAEQSAEEQIEQQAQDAAATAETHPDPGPPLGDASATAPEEPLPTPDDLPGAPPPDQLPPPD
jgi:parvulin-like peptidyl-prolyl isomerase